jgi:acetyl esterase
MIRKLFLLSVVILVLCGSAIYAAFKLSPWPSVLLIRHAFDKGAEVAANSVIPHIPKNVSEQIGLSYAPGERDTNFDLFAPVKATAPLPAVVWIHGGGFIAGSRSDLSGYLKVLAARGYVTVAIDYTLAPEAKFPVPVRQANLALAYLTANAERFNIDPERIFLAGDSAGAQIAAQTALVISDPSYASRLEVAPGLSRNALRGIVLFCGPYDPVLLNFDSPYGDFMRTVIWSYVGTRDPSDPRIAQMGVAPHVTAAFPPAFISVGNADPLAPQSTALAEALRAKGVEVDALFFPKDHQPPLEHEYQLLLSTDAGQLALNRFTAFLETHAASGASPAVAPL